jgi:hypothetical protein
MRYAANKVDRQEHMKNLSKTAGFLTSKINQPIRPAPSSTTPKDSNLPSSYPAVAASRLGHQTGDVCALLKLGKRSTTPALKLLHSRQSLKEATKERKKEEEGRRHRRDGLTWATDGIQRMAAAHRREARRMAPARKKKPWRPRKIGGADHGGAR